MKCFPLSRNLMFSSQVSSVTIAAGLEATTIVNAEPIMGHLSTGDEYDVLVDPAVPDLDVAMTTLQLRSCSLAPSKIIAVGPHVQPGKLTAVTKTNCDLVLTKGPASRGLVGHLAQLNQ